ncbi:MAG: kelch repeat-containing protein [Candidatus Sulfotelmatobacter sp.]
MKKLPVLALSVLCAVFLLAADKSKIPPLPVALTGNAVASLKSGIEVYSMMGVGTKKTWDDITSKVYVLRLKTGKWSEGQPVPGVAGRLGSSAVGIKSQVFVFGGYTVDGTGSEFVLGDVNSYFPDAHKWYRATDIPVPVAGAVIGKTQERFIYLIGGRSKNGPVNNVQVYDVQKNTWSAATPFPGTPVFGHAGGIAVETIVYVDGAKKDPSGGRGYVASDECWMGKIDHKDPNKIEWSKLPPHPGPGRFGIVAGAGERDHRILFSGGSTTPHDYKGLDAQGKPVELSPVTFAFDVRANHWETVEENGDDFRADSRGIAFTAIGPLIVGGTVADAGITGQVLVLAKK